MSYKICTKLCSASICGGHIIVLREFVWFIILNISDLRHWHMSNLMIAPVPANDPERYGSLSGMFPSLDILLEDWIERIDIGLFCVKFIQDILQRRLRFCNWLSLRCLVPLINHLPMLVHFLEIRFYNSWFDIIENTFFRCFLFFSCISYYIYLII